MENSNNKILILERFSIFINVALGLLLPLFFLPTTTEFFEYNKMALLITATVLMVVLWGIRILLGQKIELVKSALDIPLLAFTAIFILATIFSLNKNTSIFGSQGRWFPSLFGIITLVIYYYINTPNMKHHLAIRWSMLGLIFGSTLATLTAILSYFNIFLGSEAFLRTPNFNTTGSVTTIVSLAAFSIILALAYITYEKRLPMQIILASTTVLNLFFIGLINSIVGWVILGVGLISLIVFVDIARFFAQKLVSMVTLGTLLAVLLVTILPTTREVIVNAAYPLEIALPVKESWVVSSSSVQDYPLLATGPSTFHLNFTRYRPLSLNAGDLWNIRFDKPFNEILNTLATMGILGLVALLFLGSRILNLAGNARFSSDEAGLSKIAAVGTVTAVSFFFVTYATVLNTFVLFFMLSLFVAASVIVEYGKLGELVTLSFSSFAAVSTIGEASALKKEFINFIAAIPVIALVLFGQYTFSKTYLGEFYMRKAIVAAINSEATTTYDYQARAININPRRDSYHTAYAQTNLVLANALAGKADITDAEKQTVQTLIAQAIRSSRMATEVVNPLNVNNWQTRGLIYRSIAGVAQNAAEWSIASYNNAIQLDPTNPSLRLELGGIYFAANEYLAAANLFRQATALKPNYANAHYNFAQALLKLNDPVNAKAELEITKSLLSQDTEDYLIVEQEIAALSTAPEVAGAASDKPTVEEIAGPSQQTGQNQPPLSNPEEQNNLNNENINVEDLPKSGNQ
ncbi:hypothetical protein A2415_02315 [candidate division WWE3 bacterium RIFOXYC1_FULL_39_7]|uniref:Uncharacterized protein n=1 Tax=candidate division WWE3 bacterium RIFOXYC1_FULL_39_7 TaxID=1802643 RepID=A0A1F4WH14_UNCKA|nr:MAG: hypothetical protein A2415_02315 [candidate division WWE3 bacterium RIFOXYC1_FULL_39_7]